MRAYTVTDTCLTYRCDAASAMDAARVWATDMFGGPVVVGPAGQGRYMATQLRPAQGGPPPFAVLTVTPASLPEAGERRQRRQRRLVSGPVRMTAA